MTSSIAAAVTVASGPARTRASRRGTALASVLFADAVVHLYWATGAVWPAPDAESLSSAVLGFQVPFTPWILLPLALVLTVGGLAVLGRGRHGRDHRWGAVWQVGTMLVTITLVVRVMFGVLWCMRIGGDTLPAFYWLNLVLYTPLCTVLAITGFQLLGEGRALARRNWLRRGVSARSATVVIPTVLVAAMLYAAFGYAPTPQRSYEPQPHLGDISSQFVRTPVARFHYIHQGSGSPVVLLSPGAAWLVAWLPQFRALSQTHSVYVVDLPGQGFTELSDPDFTFDLDGMTSAVGSFLDALDLPAVALGGNSWSGGWALAYAQRYSSRVSALLLLAPSGLAEPDPLSWEVLKVPVVGRALTNLGAASRPAVAAGVRSLFAHPDRVTPALIDAMWAPSTLPDNLRSTYELEIGLDWRVTERALPRTRQPTLILWGDQDTVLPVDQAAQFAAAMPAAEVHVLSGCGHALSLDCPGPVNPLMVEFLHGR